MPRRTIHMLAPLDGIIADLNGRVIGRFGHCGPHGGGQAVGETVAADIRISLHHKAERRFRHAMVMVSGDGGSALTASQCRATGNALDLLRLPDRGIILDIIQSDGGA